MSMTRVALSRHVVDFRKAALGSDGSEVPMPTAQRHVSVPSKQDQTDIIRKPSIQCVTAVTAPGTTAFISRIHQDTRMCLPTIDNASSKSCGDVRQHRLAELPTLPRSRKTTKLRVSKHPPDLHTSSPRQGAASKTDLFLTVEGQDIRLPPPRLPKGSRRQPEKSRHGLNIARVERNVGLLRGQESIQSLEDSLKTLLLCQSMGVIIQITRLRDESGGLAQPMFHCDRCLRHWTVYGRPPPDCEEPETRVSGPSFPITSTSHDIIQKFTQLTPTDKQCFLEAVRAFKPIPPPQERETPCLLVSQCTREGGLGQNMKPLTRLDNEPTTDPSIREGNFSRHRGPPASQHRDSTKSLPDPAPSLQSNRDAARYSTMKDTQDARIDQQSFNDGSDGEAIKGSNSSNVHGRTDAMSPGATCITGKTPTADQAHSSSPDHKTTQGKKPITQTFATEASILGAGDGETIEIQAHYSSSTSSKAVDSNRFSKIGPGELDPNGKKQCIDERKKSLVLCSKLLVQKPDGNLHSSPGLAVQELDKLREDIKYKMDSNDTEGNVTAAEAGTVSNQDMSQSITYLSDEGVASIHAIPKVTITRSGLRQDLPYNTASFNNSAGTDDEVGSNESFERLINGSAGPGLNVKTDGNTRASSAATEGRSEAKSAQSHLRRHGNGDSGQHSDSHFGQEKEDNRERKGSAVQKNWRDGSVSYMGVMDDDDVGKLKSGISSDGMSSKISHGNIAKGSIKGQKTAPIRNTAVKNVTGRPDTRPGNLERHMFATPGETLAQTSALGVVPKSSGEGLNQAAVKSKAENDGHAGQDPTSNIQSSSYPRRESLAANNAAATKLLPLNAMSRQLPPLDVHDSEQRSKTKDRKRSLGMPRTDHPLRQLVDGRQEQGKIPATSAAKQREQESRDQSKTVARPHARGGDEDTFMGRSRPRHLREDPALSKSRLPQADEKPMTTEDFVEQPEKGRNEKHPTEFTARFLPAIESTKEELMTDGKDEQEREVKSPLMKTLFNQFDNFELSLSPPPMGSLPPVSTDKSFRMTYSTLPKTFDWDTPRQLPAVAREKLASPQPPGLISNFAEQPADEVLNAQLNKSIVVDRSSGNIYDKSARMPSKASSSKTSQVSSAAESVWESVSEIWRRHTMELQKLERMVALNFLPFTSAFTFSLFQIPPQYLAYNRSLREQAMQIRTLKRPKKIQMKFATKSQKEAAMRRPVTRRPVKPVK